MAEKITEKILGWYNDEDVVLCFKCFTKKHQHHDVAWTPIKKKEEGEDNFYVCNECETKF